MSWLEIQHGENKLSFESGLDKTKRVRLGLYINGWLKGEYSNDDHPFKKYLNPKEVKPSRKLIEIEKKYNPKLRKKSNAEIAKACDLKSFFYSTPIFDNINQIKRMVTALE